MQTLRLWILVTGLAAAMCGQTASIYGTIVGTVTDQSGALIPEVTVVATNVSTNISTEARTNTQGFYRAERLIPGTYRVAVEQAGFKRFVRDGVSLSEAQTVRVDAPLQVGAVTESVEVSEQTPLIETESPQLSSTLSWSERKFLPTRSPDFFSTLGLNAAAATSGYYISFAGSRSTQYDYSIDGQTFRDPYAGHNATVGNFNEWQQEVKTNYVNNSAEYSQLAAVNAATKSGTNSLHGSGAWYYTSGGLNGRSPFSPSRPSGVTQLFASSIGGPIRRNRAFFFAAYSGSRNHSARNVNATVPTTLIRQGNFSEVSTVLKDPSSGLPLANNAIPASQISPAAKAFIDRFYPLPNYGSGFQQLNYRTQVAQAPAGDDLVARVDYRFTDKHSLFVRYSYDEGNRGGNFTGSIPTVGFRQGYRRDQNVAVSDLYSFTPAIYNEFNAGFTRDHNLILPSSSWGPAESGLKVPKFQIPAIPEFRISDFTTVTQQDFYDYPADIFTFRDNLSWIHGRHRMKMGGLLMDDRIAQGRISGSRVYGVFTFNNTFATGYGMGNLLLGLPTTQYRIDPTLYFDAAIYRRHTFQTYFQDDIQVSRKLTVNVGLRYEFHQPWREITGRQNTFDPSTGNMIIPNAASLKLINPGIIKDYGTRIATADKAGYPEAMINFSKLNFAPRIGAAYRLQENTVVRAGYGIFYDFNPPTSQAATDLYVAPQYYPTNKIVNGAPLYRFPDPFAASATEGVGLFTLNTASVRDLRIPYSQQWSFTLERQFFGSTGLRLSYTGTKALHQIYTANRNVPPPSTTPKKQADRPYPQYGPIGWVDRGAGHFYNGVQFEVVHRSKKGLYVDSHWSWAKDVGENQGGNLLDVGAGVQSYYNRRADRGNTAFVPRQRWVTIFDWEVPVGKGKPVAVSSKLNYLLGGWRMNGILTASRGNYMTPSYCGYDPTGSPGDNFYCGRPDRWADGNLPAGDRTMSRWFDAAAFTYPGATPAAPRTPPSGPIGRFGNSGVNIIEGPGFWQFDYGLVKGIPIREWLRSNLFVLGTNIFNHPNLGNPSADISSPATVGRIYGIRTDNQTSGIGMRQIQLGLRLEF